MNCRPLRWLWGLVPLALLALFLYAVERGRVEEDLTSRAKSALQAAGITWATPTFKGRDGLLVGTSLSEEDRSAALSIVSSTPGVRIIEDRTELSAVISPFTFAAKRSGDRIVLSGFLPSERERGIINGVVSKAIANAKIEDKLIVGRGVPAITNWLGGISFGVKQLAGLKEGEISLADLDLSISGTARDKTTFAAIKKALGRIPNGVKLASDKVVLPSASAYQFSVQLDNGVLSLDGFVPTVKLRTEILAAAKSKYRNVKIVDNLVVAPGAPSGFEQASRSLVDQLARLRSGAGRVRAGSVDFSGDAQDEATAIAVAAELKRATPASFQQAPEILYPEIVAPSIRPYTWSADYANGGLTVEGLIQSEQVRRAVLAEVKQRLPNARVVDLMTVGPSDFKAAAWQSAIAYSIDQLSQLENGRVDIVDDRLTISGVAADEGVEKAVKSALLDTPEGFSLKSSKIDRKIVQIVEKPKLEAPYSWRGVVNGEQIILSGDIPNEDIRRAIIAYAEERFRGLKVQDRMKVRKGAPVSDIGWLNAMRSGLRSLALVGIGTAEIQNTDLMVSGITKTPGVPERVSRILDASIPDGFKGKPLIIYRGPSDDELKEIASEREEQERARLAELDNNRQRTEKQKKEDEARLKADAEKKKKAEDETKRKVEADRKKKADEEAKRKSEADRKRQAEDEAKQQAAAELKKKAEEQARLKLELDRKKTQTDRLRSQQDAELKSEAEKRKKKLDDLAAAEARAYVFTARYSGAAIVLEGAVPSDEVRSSLMSQVRRLYPLRKITDRMRVRADAPTDWDDAALQGLKQLSLLENGQLTLRDRLVFLSGATDQDETLQKVRSAIVKQVPKGFKGDEIVVLVKPPPPEIKERDFSAFDVDKLLRGKSAMSDAECEAVLNVVTRRVKALFRPARADLDKDGERAVKLLATVVPRCPTKRIMITGHTDSDGAAGYNQELSEQRAARVVEVLVGSGVERDQLSSQGFGEREPIAPNDSAANKAKNRRIEFVLGR